MLTVQLKVNDPGLLLDRVRHHAKAAERIVLELLAQMTLVLGSDDKQWKIVQSRPGANSFSLRNGSRQYHFRGTPGGTIKVFDRARKGNLLAEIDGRVEAKRFVESLVT